MASSWPAAFDGSFPGYPYKDNLEFVLGAYANSWVQAIQALETGIGYGSGSVPANPLYSQALNQNYSTITARIAFLEPFFQALVAAGSSSIAVIDQSVGDIQPIVISGAASVGNSGKAADGRHAHAGPGFGVGLSTPVGPHTTDSDGTSTAVARANHGHAIGGYPTLRTALTTFTVPGNVSNDPITFGSVLEDTDNAWTGHSQYDVVTPGFWIISVVINLTSPANAVLGLALQWFTTDSSGFIGGQVSVPAGGNLQSFNPTIGQRFKAGDTFQVTATNNSATPVVLGAGLNCQLTATWVHN